MLQARLERYIDAADVCSLVVADLRGCTNADGFGDPERSTFDDDWRLISAALDAFEARVS
jgi:hypothetical protein